VTTFNRLVGEVLAELLVVSGNIPILNFLRHIEGLKLL